MPRYTYSACQDKPVLPKFILDVCLVVQSLLLLFSTAYVSFCDLEDIVQNKNKKHSFVICTVALTTALRGQIGLLMLHEPTASLGWNKHVSRRDKTQ